MPGRGDGEGAQTRRQGRARRGGKGAQTRRRGRADAAAVAGRPYNGDWMAGPCPSEPP